MYIWGAFIMLKSGKAIEISILNKNDFYSESYIINSNKKMLNSNLEEYIFKAAKNYKLKEKISIKLVITSKLKENDYESMKETIHSHFSFKEKGAKLYIKQTFKQWRINMVIGILFLILCLVLVEVLEPFTYIKTLKVIKEGLLIISWVALWEPITFILFGFRPMNSEMSYYHKLSQASIVVECLKNA